MEEKTVLKPREKKIPPSVISFRDDISTKVGHSRLIGPKVICNVEEKKQSKTYELETYGIQVE